MAITQIELLQPKLILVDRDFLSENIERLTRAIAERDLEEQVDLILLSDHFQTERWQEFARLGFADYLHKSTHPNQTIDKINNLIRGDLATG